MPFLSCFTWFNRCIYNLIWYFRLAVCCTWLRCNTICVNSNLSVCTEMSPVGHGVRANIKWALFAQFRLVTHSETSTFIQWQWIKHWKFGPSGFLVACTRLYNLLCRSVRPSVCPNDGVAPNMAPAHPHKTSVAVYPALFLPALAYKIIYMKVEYHLAQKYRLSKTKLLFIIVIDHKKLYIFA